MKIGMIGAGKVGVTLGKYLSDNGICVTGYYSRTGRSADEAATFTKTMSCQSLAELAQASDTLFITTPDDAIGQVWREIAGLSVRQYIICHFSGLLSSHVFSGIEGTGNFGISIHPMYAFSDRFHSFENFNTARLTMEGDERALRVMKPLFEDLGHRVITICAEDKMKYHAAASMASNEMLGLMQTSLNLLEECGFNQTDALDLITPLVCGNLHSMMEKGCAPALTGPVERNDVQTVRKHLEVLEDSEAGMVYRSLGEPMVSLAQRKNPDRDYSQMRQIFAGRQK